MNRTISARSIAVVAFTALAILTVVLFAGCGSNNSTGPNYGNTGGPSGSPGVNQVWMQNISYNPSSMTVTHGTTVTWTNKDGITHTVTSGTPGSPDGAFNSGDIGPGGTFQHTFATAGTFHYYCMHHPSVMQATIIVQ
jgi:plastocyanin